MVFRFADGSRLKNHGGRVVQGTNEHGRMTSMSYVLANAALVLDSVSQICDSGASVTFHESGGYIEKPNGSRTMFARVGDTYTRNVWVPQMPNTKNEQRADEATKDHEEERATAVGHDDEQKNVRPKGAIASFCRPRSLS